MRISLGLPTLSCPATEGLATQSRWFRIDDHDPEILVLNVNESIGMKQPGKTAANDRAIKVLGVIRFVSIQWVRLLHKKTGIPRRVVESRSSANELSWIRWQKLQHSK